MVFRTPFFLPWIYPNLVWRLPTEEKVIYLTFDDGPVPGPTEFVLDELKKASAQATFFCIGDNVRKHPGVFSRILAEGHTVGNHTFNHLKGWNFSVRQYTDNVALCAAEMLRHSVQAENSGSDFFRPPYGRIKRSQIRALGDYKIIMWDVLTHDYAATLSPEKCLSRSIAAVRPGSVVVFHDSIKAERNMTYAFPRLIEHFGAKGFVFKSLTHGIENT